MKVPILPRTPARNTVKLVRILEQVGLAGLPLEEALIQGSGRLPVAGHAWWSDDWMAPRFNPIFHLHEGLDIFGDFGTPVRSPEQGVVSRVSSGGAGGKGVWVTGRSGAQYYFAHLQDFAPGLAAGMPVQIGTVIGYIGDTGNAEGGAPHLHFEIHRGGPIPPKPIVDAWLADAENAAPAWVAARIDAVLGERDLLRRDHALANLLAADRFTPADTPEYSLLLSLLDPVGGSVGMLPRLSLVPAPRPAGGDRLLTELIAQRVEGSLLPALITGEAAHADAH